MRDHPVRSGPHSHSLTATATATATLSPPPLLPSLSSFLTPSLSLLSQPILSRPALALALFPFPHPLSILHPEDSSLIVNLSSPPNYIPCFSSSFARFVLSLSRSLSRFRCRIPFHSFKSSMIFSHWLATLLGGSLAIHGALGAITLNVDDESQSPLSSQLCWPHSI